MTRPRHPLKEILELTRHNWDQPTERPAVRYNFHRVLVCQTPALGAEVYASANEEKVFYHTCKSKCCPSCGNRGTLLWQRAQWASLPDIPFVGVVLTMPDVFRPVFKAHRHLQHDLPALGAAVLMQWAWTRYRVRMYVIAIPHTFGGHLNHVPHLHMMASAGGLRTANVGWKESLAFDRDQIMELWRFAVTSHLAKAYGEGRLHKCSLPGNFSKVILWQAKRKWNIHITRRMSKKHFLGYAGRYVRRLPISQKRILSVTSNEVIYQAKDTRTKTLIETRCTPEHFISLLSQHVQNRYQHSMRYFGLLAPRTKPQTSATIFALFGQRQRPTFAP